MLQLSPASQIAKTNRMVFIAAMAANLGLLYACASFSSWPIKILIALLFSFTNNTMFSLLHEAVHGAFHSDPHVNRRYGILSSAFFPTVYDFQKRVHLAHHKNNRSHFEQFDFIRPGDIKWLKYAQWYSILTGIYWLFPPMGVFVLAVYPEVLASKFWTKFGGLSEQVGSTSMMTSLQKIDIAPYRFQALYTLFFQIGILWLMHWSWQSWLLCYGLFGLNWSSLQYADHAWSPLHPNQGAWNLKVPRWMHFFFLNYHYHKVHHEHPTLSWVDLKRNVQAQDPNPSFFEIYFEMWKGPKTFDPEYVYVAKNISN